MTAIYQILLRYLAQPTTYLGLFGLLATYHLTISGVMQSSIVQIGTGIASLLAVLIDEHKVSAIVANNTVAQIVALAPVTGMVMLLTACNPTQVGQAQTVLDKILEATRVGCQLDGKFVPIADEILAAIPQTSGIATADALLIHPIIMGYCTKLGASPAITIKPPAPGA